MKKEQKTNDANFNNAVECIRRGFVIYEIKIRLERGESSNEILKFIDEKMGDPFVGQDRLEEKAYKAIKALNG